MKSLAITILFVIGCSVVVSAQQPSTTARTRRGLDQLDLLTIPRSTEAVGSINLDSDTFKLLRPLIDHCKKLELDYRTAVIDDRTPLGRSANYERFLQKTGVIYRSTFLIKEMQTLSDPVKAIVDQNEQITEDVGRILAILSFGGGDAFKDQIADLNERFAISDSGNSAFDREVLVAAMLRRINANFARFRVAE